MSVTSLFLLIGLGDVCDDDIDNDTILNHLDNCPYKSNTNQLDTDNDGIGDICDNCPYIPNPSQKDADKDLIGDACDSDIDRDRDGIQDSQDNCPKVANSDQLDTDGDGRGDLCDIDMDNDGIENHLDNCPIGYNPDQLDLNRKLTKVSKMKILCFWTKTAFLSQFQTTEWVMYAKTIMIWTQFPITWTIVQIIPKFSPPISVHIKRSHWIRWAIHKSIQNG